MFFTESAYGLSKNKPDAMPPAAEGLIRSTVNGSPSSEKTLKSDSTVEHKTQYRQRSYRDARLAKTTPGRKAAFGRRPYQVHRQRFSVLREDR